MGITGHSFGGFATNYIVSHTDRFAAAIAGAGLSNIIEGYNQIWGAAGDALQFYYTDAAYKMNKSLDEIPDAYIRNSPILYTKEVKTPLLLVHNNLDRAV